MTFNLDRNNERQAQYLVIALAFFNVLIHLLFHGKLEYHRDELLYFSLGMHPAFGYETVPPLIGWIAAIMQNLFGYSVFAVKLFPALLSGVFIYLSTRIAKELGGNGYAQVLTAVAILVTQANLRAFHLFQPVPLDIVLWSCCYYVLLRYLNTEQDRWLIILGALVGFSLLNKYLIGLWVISIVIALLFSSYRNVFRKRKLYIGVGVGLLIFLPNIIWQINNGLPVFGHIAELNETQLVNVDRSAFLIDQVVMALAASLLMIPGLVYIWKRKRLRVLAISASFVVLFLFIVRGKSYYTLGVIPLLIASGAVFFESWIKSSLARVIFPILLIIISLPMVPFGIPVYEQAGMVQYFEQIEKQTGLELGRRFEDGTIHSLPQDYADQLGWQEMAEIAAKAYKQVPDKSRCVIYGGNYGHAGAIAVIGKQYGLPEPVSFHESFQYWVPSQFDPDPIYMIYINDVSPGEDVVGLFEQIDTIGTISNPHAREFGTGVYLCSKPRRSFNLFWAEILSR